MRRISRVVMRQADTMTSPRAHISAMHISGKSLVEAAGVEPASESSEAWLLHAYLTFGVSSAFCPVSGERAWTSLWIFVRRGEAGLGTLAQLNDIRPRGREQPSGGRSRVFRPRERVRCCSQLLNCDRIYESISSACNHRPDVSPSKPVRPQIVNELDDRERLAARHHSCRVYPSPGSGGGSGASYAHVSARS